MIKSIVVFQQVRILEYIKNKKFLLIFYCDNLKIHYCYKLKQFFDLKYQHLDPDELPIGECLKDTVKRVKPLWKNIIAPKILLGRKILVVAHGNSLRAIVKILDNISNEDIPIECTDSNSDKKIYLNEKNKAWSQY